MFLLKLSLVIAGIFKDLPEHVWIDTGAVLRVDEHEHGYHWQNEDHGEEKSHQDVKLDRLTSDEVIKVTQPRFDGGQPGHSDGRCVIMAAMMCWSVKETLPLLTAKTKN